MSKRISLCFLVLSLTLSQVCLIAQGAPAAKSDPQAIHMLADAFRAMGGAQLSGFADIKIDGTMAAPSSPDIVIGNFSAKARGEDWSMEAIRGASTSSYRVLKGNGSVRKGGVNKPLHPSITSGQRLDIVPLLGRWTEFSEQGSIATLVDS